MTFSFKTSDLSMFKHSLKNHCVSNNLPILLQKKRTDVGYKLLYEFFKNILLHMIVFERWAFKNLFITYVCYAPDVLFWTVLYVCLQIEKPQCASVRMTSLTSFLFYPNYNVVLQLIQWCLEIVKSEVVDLKVTLESLHFFPTSTLGLQFRQ